MTARLRLILAGVAAFLVCLLFFFFFIRPRQSELGTVRENIEAAQNENQQLTVTLDRLKELQENAPELNATLEQIRGFVPRENEVPNFVYQVQEAANLAGVGFVQITPELPDAPPEGAPLAEIRATIIAHGGYFSLQDFVRRIYALDRAVRIDTLSIGEPETAVGGTTATTTTTGTADEDALALTIAARIFFELPEGGAAPVPGATPAPATTPAPGTSPAPASPAPASPAPASPAPAPS